MKETVFLDVIATGNLRFIGASLLHVTTSATVGLGIALSFLEARVTKRFTTIIGIL